MTVPETPIRIAFCITELDPGGAERALLEVVKRLDGNLFEAKVFCLGPRAPLVQDFEAAGIPVVCLGAKRTSDIFVLTRLLKALRQFRPTILQTWLFHANILGRLAGRLAGVPIIVSGIRVAEKRSRRRLWLDRATQRFVAAHVCVSQSVADFSIAQGGLDPARVHVIPNGVDVDRFDRASVADLTPFGIPPDASVVLFVGRLDPQKDPLWLLDVFPAVAERIGNVHLVFVGQGSLYEPLRLRIEQDALQSRVHLLGLRSDVPALLKAADVLVLPSRWEGMPNVVLEAFAAKTAVVATEVEGISELITDGETGYIVASRNSDQLATRLGDLLESRELRTKLESSAQSLVSQRFTLDAAAKSYAGLYQDLCQKIHYFSRRKSPGSPPGKII